MKWDIHWGREIVFGYEFDVILAEAIETWLDSAWHVTDEGTEVHP